MPPPAPRTGSYVFAAAILYGFLAWYGGIRSPDGEVVFEMCEALHDRKTVSVEGVSRHVGFGLAEGRDGLQYSIFGPGQSLVCLPMLTIARYVNRTHWFETGGFLRPNPSFYVSDGYESFLAGRRPGAPILHAERAIVSFMNVIATALGALLFWRIAQRIAPNPIASLAATALYLLGTPTWHYAGTFFSEPLGTLLQLLSLLLALDGRERQSFAAGAAVGAAALVHVTALLAAPFLAVLAAASSPRRGRTGTLFVAGIAIPLAALAVYNHVRYGDYLETGRNVQGALLPHFEYGHFVAPWRGLRGLTIGAGKGLFVFAPAVVLGIVAWPALHRRHSSLAIVLAAAVLARLAFIASRSDWHGGFSLGPRLMQMAMPMLVLPVAPWLEERLRSCDRRSLLAFAAFGLLCVGQQCAFVVGEPFAFYQGIRTSALLRHVDVFSLDEIYLNWPYSPALHLLGGERGSWLLREIPLSNALLSAALFACVGASLSLAGWWAWRRAPRPRSPGTRDSSSEEPVG